MSAGESWRGPPANLQSPPSGAPPDAWRLLWPPAPDEDSEPPQNSEVPAAAGVNERVWPPADPNYYAGGGNGQGPAEERARMEGPAERRGERYRRSRSRSRSPDRGSSRRGGGRRSSRSRSRSPRYNRRESRSPEYGPQRPPRRRDEQTPTNVIMMRNLPMSADENTLWLRLLQDQYTPVDIRVMRNKETGQNRGFGFVEFAEADEARRWMQATKGVYKIDERCFADLQYSNSLQTRGPAGGGGGPGAPGQQPDASGGQPGQTGLSTLSGYGNTRPGDWLCSNCQVVNFKYRDRCFKCTRDRAQAEQHVTEPANKPTVTPCDTLVFSNLPWSCVEEDIRSQLRRVSTLEPVNIHIDTSKGTAHVQMRSVHDASRLHTTLTTMTKLVVGLNKITVDFANVSGGGAVQQQQQQPHALGGQTAGASGGGPPPNNRPPADTTNAAAELALIAMKKAQLMRQAGMAHGQFPGLSAAVSTAVSQAAGIPTSGMMSSPAALASNLLATNTPGLNQVINPQAIAAMLQHKQLQQLQAAATAANLQQQRNSAIQLQQQIMQQVAASSPNALPQAALSLLGQPMVTSSAGNSAIATAIAAAQQHHQLMQQQAMAAAAASKTPTSSAGAGAGTTGALGTVNTPYGELPIYPAPDTTTYQFEPTSGYYFDPGTGLYYDGQSRLYYNGDTHKWLYWDAQYKTYLPVEAGKNPLDEALEKSKAELDKDKEEKDTKDKEEKAKKVRTAKQIQKDMERWAKQQNKQSKHTVAPGPSGQPDQKQPAAASTSGGASDIAFSVLEKTALSKDARLAFDGGESDDEEQPPPNAVAAASRTPVAQPPQQQLRSDEDVDYETLACLLCRRKFPSAEVLEKHVKMSKLHRDNLDAKPKKSSSSSGGGGGAADTLALTLQYRDRAKERRDKFGSDDSSFARSAGKVRDNRYGAAPTGLNPGAAAVAAASMPAVYEQPTVDGIKEDNVGNKLLSKMGWKSGQGLGKANQGIVNPIQAELRNDGAGLGAKGSAKRPLRTGEEYKSSVYAAMRERFNELEQGKP